MPAPYSGTRRDPPIGTTRGNDGAVATPLEAGKWLINGESIKVDTRGRRLCRMAGAGSWRGCATVRAVDVCEASGAGRRDASGLTGGDTNRTRMIPCASTGSGRSAPPGAGRIIRRKTMPPRAALMRARCSSIARRRRVMVVLFMRPPRASTSRVLRAVPSPRGPARGSCTH